MRANNGRDGDLFRLPVVHDRLVREADIAALLFYEFWQQSAAGSAQLVRDGERFVPLTDWEAFARLFIETGRHRWQQPS